MQARRPACAKPFASEYHAKMQLTVNGESVALDGPCSVRALLERCNLSNSPCAVEVNRVLVPRRRHGDHTLHDGDSVEIVTLVGGG